MTELKAKAKACALKEMKSELLGGSAASRAEFIIAALERVYLQGYADATEDETDASDDDDDDG